MAERRSREPGVRRSGTKDSAIEVAEPGRDSEVGAEKAGLAPAFFVRRDFELPATLEDTFSALQWAAGCAGVEIRGEGAVLQMSVFFPPGSPPPPFDAQAWATEGIRLLGEHEQPDEDWAANYRAQASPLKIGALVLDPREPDSDPPPLAEDDLYLRLPARTAFGTGSHESTRLALELLATLDLRDRWVLDVGTGTGVLAFVASARGAEHVLAFDVDPAAALVARENARLNGIEGIGLFAGRLSAIGRVDRRRFDLVLINILPHNVRAELALLESLVATEAELIFSGLTVDTESEIRELLGETGWRLESSARDHEWVALAFRRGAAR